MKLIVKIFLFSLFFLGWGATLSAQTDSWVLMRRGDKYFLNGDFRNAQKCYSGALQKDTTNVRALYNLGTACMGMDSARLALENFNKITQNYKDKDKAVTAKAFHNKGTIYETMANMDSDLSRNQALLKMAIEEYKGALRLNPKSEESRYNLVLCIKQLEKQQSGEGGNSNQKDQSKDQDNQKKDQKDQQKQDQNKNKQSQPQPQQDKSKNQQNNNNSAQNILNMVRQQEEKTKEKLQVRPRQRNNKKNW